MKKIFFLLLIIFNTLISLNAQTYNIDTDNSITTCAGTIYDSGGSAGDYGANDNNSIVVYSNNPGSQVHLDIEFDIEPYDYFELRFTYGAYLKIYDGTDASAPLIATIWGLGGNVTVVGNNASEALFLVFRSFDNDIHSGFSAEISCGPALPPLPDNDNCANATQICSIDGYIGTTSITHTADLPGDMCHNHCSLFDGTIHNNSWISFTSMATSVSLQIVIDNCHHVEGIQFGIYSGTDCDHFALLSEYEYTSYTDAHRGTYTFNASGLDIGSTYYFMADGSNGDVCNYELTVISGIMDGSISGPEDVYCTPSTYIVNSSATSFEWTGLTGATFTGHGTNTITVTDWGALTSTTISCEQMAGDCIGDISQLSVNIHPETTISDPITICDGATTTLAQTGPNNLWFKDNCPNLWMEDWNYEPDSMENTTLNSVMGGLLNVTSTSAESAFEMPNIGSFPPSAYRYIQIRYRVTAGTAGNAEIFFYNTNNDTVTVGESVQGAIVSDGNWNTLILDMHTDPDYLTGGDITGWRYDWCSANGVTMEIDYIALSSQIAINYGTSIDVTPTAETKYYVIPSAYCPCLETTVSLSAVLNGGEIGTSQSICNNTVPAAFTNTTPPTGGTGTWTYEWEYQENCLGTWASITSSNSLTYTEPTNLTTNRCYRRKATNDCGTEYSNTITITVHPVLIGGGIETDQHICYNTAPPEFTNTATPIGGTGTWTYEWEYDQDCSGNWTAIASSNSLNYTELGNLTTDRCYRRKATNNCGTVYSNTIRISIYPELDGGEIGTAEIICYNASPVAFTNVTLPTGGNGGWTYEWEYQENCIGTIWTPIAGSNSLTFDAAALTGNRCYRRSATNNCGTVYSNIIAITVYAELDGGEIATDQSICYNTSPASFTNVIAPAGGNGSWTYEWEYQEDCTGAWTSFGISSLSFTDGTSLTVDRCYRRAASNNCGTTYSNTITITVHPLIDVYAGLDQSISNGTSTSINDATVNGNSSPSGFDYSWTPAANLIDADILHPTTTNLDFTTVFTLTVEDEITLCTNSDNIQITITGGPLSVITSGSTASICLGDTIELTSSGSGGSGIFTYSWVSNPVGFISSDQNISVGPITTTTYTVEIDDGFNTATANIVVTVNPLPLITIVTDEADDTLCLGEDVILTASGNSDTYIWGNSVINSTAFTPTLTNDYIVTGTINSTGCENFDTIQIVVNPLPVITIVSDEADDTLCFGEDIVLTASGNADVYIWDNTVINGVVFTPTNTYDYIVTSTINSTGCINFDTIQVVVNPLPIITIVTDEIDDTLCFGEDIVLTASGNADTYIWNNTIINGVAFSHTNTSDYIVTSTITATGCQNFDTIQIVINPLPTINNISITDVVSCINSDGSIDISVNGGTSPYIYSIDTGNTTSTSNMYNGLNSGNYIIYVEDINGCTDTSSALIGDPTMPTIDSLFITDILCNGDSTGAVTIYSEEATTYSVDSGLTHQNESSFTGLSVGNYQIWISDTGSCISVGNLTINEPTELELSLDNVTNLVCNNDSSGSIQVSATGGTLDYSYGWSNGDITNIISELNSGNYSVTLSDNNNCIDTMSIEIGQPTQMLITDTSYFENHHGVINLLAIGGTPDYTYNWSNGETASNVYGLSSGDYWVTVSDANGCLLTNFYKIDIEIIIPTVITPNNDGFNDYFRITNIDAFEEIDIKIFTRWGDRVFNYEGTGIGYENQSNQWDGTFNGKDLPLGTYICIVDLKNNKDVYTGTVTIVR